MRSAKVNTGDSGLASQYNNLRSDAYGGSQLLVHQQTTPGMTLYVEPGVYRIGANRYIYAGGNTPSFTAPSAHSRIDIVTIDGTGTVAITQGTEAVSPTAPAYPLNKLVLAEIYNRVGETALYDADPGGSNGYVYNDVRPFLGGAYISSDSQVDAAAAISFSKLNAGAINADLIPDGDGTRNFGSLADEWNNGYFKTIYANGTAVGGKFGGSGADGALSISSGTTTIDCANALYTEKNYSSISITGTGKLAFINPNTRGSFVLLRSLGNVTLTSSTAPMLDMSGMGAAGGGGSAGTAGVDTNLASINGGGNGGASFNGTGGGAAGGTGTYSTDYHSFNLGFRRILLATGAGGGAGGQSGQIGGTNGGAGGGNGGGALLLECAGALNFTTTNGISVAGQNGSSGGGSFQGGGGGGAGGTCVILYNSLTANTGTINISGGTGGNGYNTSGGNGVGGAGGNGTSGNGNGGSGGNTASVGNGWSAGSGGGGGACQGPSANGSNGTNGTQPGSGGGGGGGGAAGYSLAIKNIYFA